MTRDQLEELVERLEHGAKPERYEDFAAADYRQLCGEATTLLRSMLAQEPVAWMYAPKDCSIRPTPWAKRWPEHAQSTWVEFPLYAAPVPAVDPEWKAEAMRLADKYALRTAEDFRDDSYRAGGFQDQARAALAAHLDKLGGK